MNNYQKEQQIIEWLQDYNSYIAGVKNLKETIDDIAEANMGISYGEDSVGSSNGFNSKVENAVIKIDKLNIERKIKIMTNIINTIQRALDSLNDIERSVIVNRCIERRYYYEFCHKIGTGERNARRIKKGALKKMSIVIFGIE